MRKENACALSLISPLFLAAGRLSGPSGRKPPSDKGNAQKAKGAKLQLFERFCGPTFFSFMEVWGGLSPCRREQETGFCPARENRSSARARIRKESCACETGRRQKHGARFARRGRAPGKNRVRARRGEEKDTVRDLLGAAAHPEPTAGVRGWAKREAGQTALRAAAAPQAASRVTRLPAQTALRRDGACANCPAQPRRRVVKGV